MADGASGRSQEAGFPDSPCRRIGWLALTHARTPRNFTDSKLTIAWNLMRTVAEYSRRIED
jgi:hypothetical protein